MKQNTRIQNGFTLIELLIFVTIVGVLVSNLLPRLLNNPERKLKIQHKATRQFINSQLDIYYIQNKQFPVEGELTKWSDYVEDYFPKGIPQNCNAGSKWIIKNGKVDLSHHQNHE